MEGLQDWGANSKEANGECVNGKPSAGTQRFHGFRPGILSSASETSQRPRHHPERECGGEVTSLLLSGMNKFKVQSFFQNHSQGVEVGQRVMHLFRNS